jgi:uncharacterized protein (TIGR00375 family)
MQVFADLHIHSRFSIATSRSMTPGPLVAAAREKGLAVLGSGDALHPGWRACWEDCPGGEGILVVPTAEVEDASRVHHLILMETFEDFASLARDLAPYSKDIGHSGRPHMRLGGEEIAGMVHLHGGLIGPAHAFTPWTSLYAAFDSPRQCYGDEPVDFLELGLSADSSYGCTIPDLADLPFLSNSDCHSPDTAKLGREFNRIEVSRLTAGALLDAVRSGRITMNAGFFPEEGKYNRTACIRCFRQYEPDEAGRLNWRCPVDGGRIKIGVRDRAKDLSTGRPQERPPYLHMIPLAELIQKVLGTASPRTKGCRNLYNRFIEAAGDEISVLLDTPVPELRDIHPGVAGALDCLRAGRVVLEAGGGGRYGSFSFL